MPPSDSNPEPERRPAARTPAPCSERAGAAVVWAVCIVCMAAPAAGVVWNALRNAHEHGPVDLGISAAGACALGRSAGYAALIAATAVVLAWPAAVVLSRARAAWLVVAATPMLLPSYLAYAGWSIARTPTTPLGRWIAAAPEHGAEWLPLAAARALAIWGLALWAWPLAAVVLAAGLRAVDAQIGESLRLERCGLWRRTLTQARAAWPSVAAGWGLVALLMLGSAVPLHVARVQTYAIRVWMVLDEHPAEPWRAWATAWPLVVTAAGAGWLLSGRLTSAGRRLAAMASDEARGPRPGPPSMTAAATPWVLAVLVPFGLFWSSMGGVGSIGRLLVRAGAGIATSAGVGAAVGLLAAVVCLAAAQASARRGGSSIRGALALSLVWMLLPGVLGGAAIAQVVRALPGAWADSVTPMVLAHLSRSAFLPILVGVWLGAGEPGGVAESRVLDGALGLANWARTSLRPAIGPALAVGMACGCLSFHEIESSVQVQPPGIDHMAQRLLQWLHYERMGELSAAGVLLLGLGMGMAAAVALATWRPRSRTPRDPRR